MGSVMFPCGCLVSWDMYSGKTVSVAPCSKHAPTVQAELDALRAALKGVLDGERSSKAEGLAHGIVTPEPNGERTCEE